MVFGVQNAFETTKINCPIWQVSAMEFPSPQKGRSIFSFRAGGQYLIDRSACAMLSSFNVRKKILLTAWLVEQRRLGVSCPKISTATLNFVTKRQPLSDCVRAINLLRYLDAKSALLGEVIFLKTCDDTQHTQYVEIDYEFLAWTNSQKMSEVIALAEYCHEQGWIDLKTFKSSASPREAFHHLMLKPSGDSYLAGLARSNSGSNQVFVAMWFDQSMENSYEVGIAPAIRGTGYEPLRIDRKEHNNKIDDQIFAEIERSRFLVADFTQGDAGARDGVYFEAGFAKGRNIPVIFTCRKDAICKVHFDTRQYNHIIWETPEDLMNRLFQRISETQGDGQFQTLDSSVPKPLSHSPISKDSPTTGLHNPHPIPPPIPKL